MEPFTALSQSVVVCSSLMVEWLSNLERMPVVNANQLVGWLDDIRQCALQCDLLLKRQRPIVSLPEFGRDAGVFMFQSVSCSLLKLFVSVCRAVHSLWKCLTVVTAILGPNDRQTMQVAINSARNNFAKCNVILMQNLTPVVTQDSG